MRVPCRNWGHSPLGCYSESNIRSRGCAGPSTARDARGRGSGGAGRTGITLGQVFKYRQPWHVDEGIHCDRLIEEQASRT